MSGRHYLTAKSCNTIGNRNIGIESGGGMEMDFNKSALSAVGSLCNNKLFSDVVFTFKSSATEEDQQGKYEGVEIYGHKNILAARSEYFYKMFQADPNGQFVKKSNSCNIVDVDPDIFLLVMKYIYSDTWEIEHLTVDIVLDILYAADQFRLDVLITKCVGYINDNMSPNNIYLLLHCFDLLPKEVIAKLNLMIQEKTKEILQNPSFIELAATNLAYILQNDNLTAPEIEIFNLVLRWAKEKCKRESLVANGENIRKVLGPALALIRFPAMTNTEFTQMVVPEQILTIDEEIWVYRTIGNGGIPLNLSNDEYITPMFDLKKRVPPMPLKCPRCDNRGGGKSCNLYTRYCSSYSTHY